LPVAWRAVQPNEGVAPDWSGVDSMVQGARTAGLTPVLSIEDAPDWAEGCNSGISCRPNPQKFAAFGAAAAQHYNGTLPGIPWVRYWEAWNEPNIFVHLTPQYNGKNPASPAIYRAMLNAFTPAVKAVNPANLVIAGSLHPFGTRPVSVAPLEFMRQVLCISKGTPKPTCSTRVHFDIWGTNPYTQGGPTGHAINPDGVSFGDLPKESKLLRAANRAHHIDGAAPLWITEFSWDSKPPDPGGLPMSILTRWTAEAVYQAWRSHVGALIWFQIRDYARAPGEPHSQAFESGLFLRGATVADDVRKPVFTAFRFPFVAYKTKKGVYVWGQLPPGSPAGTVEIDSYKSGSWHRLTSYPVGGLLFSKSFRSSATGPLRAVGPGGVVVSASFSLKAPKAPKKVCPFGCP